MFTCDYVTETNSCQGDEAIIDSRAIIPVLNETHDECWYQDEENDAENRNENGPEVFAGAREPAAIETSVHVLAKVTEANADLAQHDQAQWYSDQCVEHCESSTGVCLQTYVTVA